MDEIHRVVVAHLLQQYLYLRVMAPIVMLFVKALVMQRFGVSY